MIIASDALSAEMLAQLAAIHGDAFADNGQGWSSSAIDQLCKAPGALLVTDDATHPSGFCLLRQVHDEAELLTIAVHPPRWNKGCGTALLSEACRALRAQGCNFVFLEVAARNARARHIYDRLGFSQIGIRPGYYGTHETGTALVMRVSLCPPNS